jgi:small conductance mechanosensitive channel
MVTATAPLTDVSHWARGSGLEIVLIVIGTVLLTRLATWIGARVTRRIDVSAGGDSLVRTEAAKHRHTLTQVVLWTVLVVVYCLAAVLVLKRAGVPLSGFVAPATVVGVALGFGAQRIVQDVLAGFFVITERQYGFGDLVRFAVQGSSAEITGTVEELTLRITRVRTSNGEVVITPNGQIVQVINLSRDWARAVVDVPVPARPAARPTDRDGRREHLHRRVPGPDGRPHPARQAVRGRPGPAGPDQPGVAPGRHHRPGPSRHGRADVVMRRPRMRTPE